MAGTVQELRPVAGVGDQVAGGGVHRLRPARRDGRSRRAARWAAYSTSVVVGEVGGRAGADDVGAGRVGAVAGGHGAADVDHDRVAGGDPPVGGGVVRAGAVGSGGDDDEVHGRVTGRPDRGGDVRADLGLGPARSQPLAISAWTESIAAPASRSAATSAGDLRSRSSRSTSPARRWVLPGNAARSARTCSAHIRLPRPTVPTGPPRARTTSGYGSVPSAWSTMRTPVPGAGDASAAGRSRAGTTSVGSPCAGSTRQVSRSCACAW